MQMPCTHILLAIDLSESASVIAQRAMQFAELNHAKLTVLHVHEKDIEAEHIFVDQKKYRDYVHREIDKTLQQLLSSIDIPQENWLIKIGIAKDIIIDTAKELSCDLIILGSHGKSGLQKILGSTTNSVINHAPCDVLSIKVKA